MKRSATILVTLLLSVCAYSQTRYYCEVKGIEKEFSSGLKIIFDFGEHESYNVWGSLSNKLVFVNAYGTEIKFNSMVDAANYMVSKGWTFQQAYASSYDNKSVTCWIFYKDAESFQQAREGIMTKEDYKRRK